MVLLLVFNSDQLNILGLDVIFHLDGIVGFEVRDLTDFEGAVFLFVHDGGGTVDVDAGGSFRVFNTESFFGNLIDGTGQAGDLFGRVHVLGEEIGCDRFAIGLRIVLVRYFFGRFQSVEDYSGDNDQHHEQEDEKCFFSVHGFCFLNLIILITTASAFEIGAAVPAVVFVARFFGAVGVVGFADRLRTICRISRS